MKKDEFTLAVLNNIGLEPSYLVKKKIRTVPNITAKDLFDAVYDRETVKGVASHFSIGVSTVNRIMKEIFPNIKILGGSRSWRYYLLDLVGYKMCTSCEEIKAKDSFYSGHLCEVRSTCKSCDKVFSANRRVKIPEVTPLDACLDTIAKIYAGCPEGYHVDHIIPLSKGGNHHQDNLCYLVARDNLLKSNKLPEEVPEIMARAIFP